MTRRLRRLIAGLLIGGAAPLAAAQGIVVHGVSRHTTGEFNDQNLGIGYVTEGGTAFGAYRNSEGSSSVYLAYRRAVNPHFSVSLGGALGYRNAPVMPVVMPTLSLPLGGPVWLSVGASPMYSAETRRAGFVFHTMMEIRL